MSARKVRDAARPAHPSRVRLSPTQDVELRDDSFWALSQSPWLRIESDFRPPAGRWVRLTYVASLFDPLARPVIRCITENSFHDDILPAALFGRAVWIGHIAEGTREIWISPSNRPGPFGFAIEDFVPISTPALIWQCFARNPHRCLTGIGAHLIGLKYAAKTEFRRVLSATPLDDYDAWRKPRLRALDLTSLDRPRSDWTIGPHIRFVAHIQAGDLVGLKALVSQLQAQPYPNWTLVVVSTSPIAELPALDDAGASVMFIRPDARARELLEGLSDDDIVAPVATGDLIPAYSVAALAEAAHQYAATDIFYGDEDFLDANGRFSAPQLRPDWSPVFCAASFYMGAAVFFRVGIARRFTDDSTALDYAAPEKLAKNALRQQPMVTHIRRVMRTRSDASALNYPGGQAPNSQRLHAVIDAALGPCATIIIPTKDEAELLRGCIESLRGKTALRNIEIIVVDNGSVEVEALHFLAELAHDQRVRVMTCPGPFNFAKLCNDAAAQARASTLVFLNNDTEVIDPHWLEPLLYWAQQSEIGAAGAKLLYPSGHVQHAGGVLGIDGRAGHFERMSVRNAPGYFGRLCLPHEVSAVTAACLAIDTRKFAAAGGFDEVNLPIELNDIDLCLRLKELGWTSVCVPDSVLIHHESASRGTTLRPDELYPEEHRYFRDRWLHRLRDDPYFHPALSLDSLGPALG